jgi:hypothetical protein
MTTLDADRLPALYKAIFEDDARGQVLLADLQARFCRRPNPDDFTQEGMLRGFVRTHQREVVEYIVRQINRADGVEEESDQPDGDMP